MFNLADMPNPPAGLFPIPCQLESRQILWPRNLLLELRAHFLIDYVDRLVKAQGEAVA